MSTEGQSAAIRVVEAESGCVQEQSSASRVRSEGAVLNFVAMLAVANDGVSKVAHVQPDLMIATGFWGAFKQAEPSRLVAGYGIGQFTLPQGSKWRSGWLRWARHALGKGFADASIVVDPSPDHGEILLAGLLIFKLSLARIDGFRVLAKEDDPARGFVQPVNRVDAPSIMLTQQVPEVFRLMRIQRGFVHQQTPRLAHAKIPVVLVEQPNASCPRYPYNRSRRQLH